MNIKSLYAKFRQWQQHPLEFKESHEHHHCSACHHDFEGRFCPTCGQKGSVGTITWESIRQGVMDIWGMGTRSLPSTIVQLIGRPGYLINDYINGNRQISFPPVKMLVFVGLGMYLFTLLLGLDLQNTDDSNGIFSFMEKRDVPNPLNTFLVWVSSHYDYAALFMFAFYALPTYIVFRHSPRNARHTLPQAFFIQVFNATQFLCFVLIHALLCKWPGLPEMVSDLIVLLLIPMLLYFNYRQLFGYSRWGTLWRVIHCLFLWLSSFVTLMAIEDVIYNSMTHKNNYSLFFGVLILFIFFLSTTLIVIFINRRGEKKRLKKKNQILTEEMSTRPLTMA